MNNKNAAATTEPTAEQVAGAVSWVPKEVGETITGTIVGFRTYEHAEFGKSPVAVVDTGEEGPQRVRLVYVIGVLLGQFKEMGGAAKGDRYTVIYLGDVEGKRKTSKGEAITYHNYASYKGDAPELAETVDLSLFD